MTVVNTGTTDVTFSAATVTGGTQGTQTGTITNTDLVAGATETVVIDVTSLTASASYSVELVSSKGNTFTSMGTAS
jgi:hypothetical protein